MEIRIIWAILVALWCVWIFSPSKKEIICHEPGITVTDTYPAVKYVCGKYTVIIVD